MGRHPMASNPCHWGVGIALASLLQWEARPRFLADPLTSSYYQKQYRCTCKGVTSVDHASAVAAPKSDPVFLHVKTGMTVIVTDTEGAWRMADVIWVDGGARNPKVPTLFQVADVDTGVINWINAELVTHIVPRV